LRWRYLQSAERHYQSVGKDRHVLFNFLYRYLGLALTKLATIPIRPTPPFMRGVKTFHKPAVCLQFFSCA